MATYYVDPDAGGDDDGTSEANAWTSLQRAIDGTDGTAPTAGDTVYLKHGTGNDEAPSAAIDFDGNSGTSASLINWIGVNSSWADDGTRYIIDGGSNAGNQFNMASEYHFFKNIELNNSQDHTLQFEGYAAHPMIFQNCIFHNAANEIIDPSNNYSRAMLFILCHFTSGGGSSPAYYRAAEAKFLWCVFADNSGPGLSVYHEKSLNMYGCIVHNNGGIGIYCDYGGGQEIINCVIDGNSGDGIQVDEVGGSTVAFDIIIGNRITNNTIGLDVDANAGFIWELYNFYLNNSTSATQGSPSGGTGSLSAGTEGYNDSGNDDFNLTTSATLRRTAIDLGYGS